MVTNAMWYHSDEVENDQVVRIGPIIFSAAALVVSVFSSLAVIPINLVIVQFFRLSRPKDWEPEMEEVKQPEMKADADDNDEEESDDDDDDGDDDDDTEESDVSDDDEKTEEVKMVPKSWWKQKYPLPHQCVYAAWMLAVASIIGSGFFVIMYSLEWGKMISEEWLSALMFSFAESIVFVQPFKVIYY